jgi:hypothetical protein
MRVLVAAESAELAAEARGMGLLTQALVREGMQADADRSPKDYEITLEEWLAYAVHRVPKLFQSLPKGAHAFPQELQHPVLFDYSRGRQVILRRLPHPLDD